MSKPFISDIYPIQYSNRIPQKKRDAQKSTYRCTLLRFLTQKYNQISQKLCIFKNSNKNLENFASFN